MINKDNEVLDAPHPPKENKPVDVVDLDIQCHILIRDIDTNEIIVNTRG